MGADLAVLGIDGGRTGCRVVAATAGGRRLAAGPGLGRLAGPDAVAQLHRALAPTLAALGTDALRVRTVCAGLTGLGEVPAAAAAVACELRALTGAERVVVAGDMITSYVGALGLTAGVMVAAGSGVVATAVAADGRVARADGWGFILGDHGSGFQIGQQGLAGALRHRDGRGGSAELARRAKLAFGPLEGIAGEVYGAPNPAGMVAGFATEVLDAAAGGDPAAAAIVASAARDLGATAVAAARALPAPLPRPLSWTGRLFLARELMLAPFLAHVAESMPSLEPRPPIGDALDGALLLADAPRRHLLADHVVELT